MWHLFIFDELLQIINHIQKQEHLFEENTKDLYNHLIFENKITIIIQMLITQSTLVGYL